MVAVFAVLSVFSISPNAFALPTARFTVTPTVAVVGHAATFNASASTCDVPPCRYQWVWYRLDGRLGAAMGEGKIMRYTFTTRGIKRVVLKVTNSTRTHGSTTVTRAVLVT
jgi:hypothetical protein